eukprot:5283757-Pyramimonas_sp.AAC.1
MPEAVQQCVGPLQRARTLAQLASHPVARTAALPDGDTLLELRARLSTSQHSPGNSKANFCAANLSKLRRTACPSRISKSPRLTSVKVSCSPKPFSRVTQCINFHWMRFRLKNIAEKGPVTSLQEVEGGVEEQIRTASRSSAKLKHHR